METGFLRLEVGANVASNTKATEDEVPYNAKVLQVSILKANGEKACDPFEYDATSSTAEKKIIELPTGTYSIHAASVGFDGIGGIFGFDQPIDNGNISYDFEVKGGLGLIGIFYSLCNPAFGGNTMIPEYA